MKQGRELECDEVGGEGGVEILSSVTKEGLQEDVPLNGNFTKVRLCHVDICGQILPG